MIDVERSIDVGMVAKSAYSFVQQTRLEGRPLLHVKPKSHIMEVLADDSFRKIYIHIKYIYVK